MRMAPDQRDRRRLAVGHKPWVSAVLFHIFEKRRLAVATQDTRTNSQPRSDPFTRTLLYIGYLISSC